MINHFILHFQMDLYQILGDSHHLQLNQYLEEILVMNLIEGALNEEDLDLPTTLRKLKSKIGFYQSRHCCNFTLFF